MTCPSPLSWAEWAHFADSGGKRGASLGTGRGTRWLPHRHSIPRAPHAAARRASIISSGTTIRVMGPGGSSPLAPTKLTFPKPRRPKGPGLPSPRCDRTCDRRIAGSGTERSSCGPLCHGRCGCGSPAIAPLCGHGVGPGSRARSSSSCPAQGCPGLATPAGTTSYRRAALAISCRLPRAAVPRMLTSLQSASAEHRRRP
jgi:hypothetical protein